MREGDSGTGGEGVSGMGVNTSMSGMEKGVSRKGGEVEMGLDVCITNRTGRYD